MKPKPNYDELLKENAALREEVAALREEVAHLKRMLFGKKRRRFRACRGSSGSRCRSLRPKTNRRPPATPRSSRFCTRWPRR